MTDIYIIQIERKTGSLSLFALPAMQEIVKTYIKCKDIALMFIVKLRNKFFHWIYQWKNLQMLINLYEFTCSY